MVAPEQIPVPGSGSVEICMLSLARQFAKHHQVTLVSRLHHHTPRVSKMGRLTIVRVPAGSPSRYLGSVLHYIKGKHFDFIQIDNRPHYMAKVKEAFPRTPVALFLHSLTFVPKTDHVERSLGKADLIIGNSASLKKILERRFSGVGHKIRTVHLGVDTVRFNPPSPALRMQSKRKYGLETSFTMLFVGRVIPRKGVPVLIKAAQLVRRKVPRAKLVVAGGGKARYLASLKALAKRLTVPVVFLGRKSHAHIHEIYRLGDCFLCPSQKHEAFGLVNVEAMAAGVPVVASNIGGIREIIRHGENGYLVGHYQSPEAFARYIIRIAKDPKLAKRLSIQGRKTVLRRFSWSHPAGRLLRIYRRQIRR